MTALSAAQRDALNNLHNFFPELGKASGVENPNLGSLLHGVNGGEVLGPVTAVGTTAPVQRGLAFAALTSNAKGAGAANRFDILGQVRDAQGAAIPGIRDVFVRSLAITDNGGDLANAAPSTNKRAVNPATNENFLWIRTDANGAFSFTCTNTVAEDTVVHCAVDGCTDRVFMLT